MTYNPEAIKKTIDKKIRTQLNIKQLRKKTIHEQIGQRGKVLYLKVLLKQINVKRQITHRKSGKGHNQILLKLLVG
jgi:hypothetical protein